jgi:periplasmic protein CpxP/Spy
MDLALKDSFEKERSLQKRRFTMLKQSLIALVAAGVISVAVPYVAAQDNSSTGQSNSQSTDPQAPQAQGNGRWHHGPPDPAMRTQELTKKLKLTADQQTKVQEVLQTEKSQMESLRQDTASSQQDRRAKMMEIRQTSDGQIRTLLDSTQQKKWDAMQAKREQRMEHRRGGPPNGGDQQAPPPQQ